MVSEVDRDKLVAFVHGELNPVDAERLLARLKTDENLRLEYEALLAVDGQLEDLFSQRADHGLDSETVLRALGPSSRERSPVKRRSYVTAGGAALAASFVLAVVMWTKQQPSKSARFTPAPEAMDAVTVSETQRAAPLAPSALPAPSAPPQDLAVEIASPEKQAKSESLLAKQKSMAAPARARARAEQDVSEESRAFAGPAHEQETEAKEAFFSAWLDCETASDCVLMEYGCDLQAINTKFQAQFIESSRRRDMTCKGTVPLAKDSFRASCQKSKCEKVKRDSID